MPWFLSDSLRDYSATAEGLVRAHAGRNTILLGAAETLRARRMVDDRLSYRGYTLWEQAGQPVSLAGLTRQVAGQVRVGPVYTPPGLRGRGYGGAATWAVSHAAQRAGAAQVVLFTDLANPTSNALYQRLGYQPVADRLVLAFGKEGR